MPFPSTEQTFHRIPRSHNHGSNARVLDVNLHKRTYSLPSPLPEDRRPRMLQELLQLRTNARS